jgi:hypothetical protein
MRQHDALSTRIVSPNRLHPRHDRDDFFAIVEHALKTAGATTKLLSDQALELLWRASRGILRTTAHLLRNALAIAHERDQTFVDDAVVNAAIDDLALTRPNSVAPDPALRTPAPKSRSKSGTGSRG